MASDRKRTTVELNFYYATQVILFLPLSCCRLYVQVSDVAAFYENKDEPFD